MTQSRFPGFLCETQLYFPKLDQTYHVPQFSSSRSARDDEGGRDGGRGGTGDRGSNGEGGRGGAALRDVEGDRGGSIRDRLEID